jgi:uncharacterized lipoprotein YajG
MITYRNAITSVLLLILLAVTFFAGCTAGEELPPRR